jgi:D-xylose 1-dehydrogenase
MSNASHLILKEKAVLLSGGASGMAEAIVRSFAVQGARVSFVNLVEDAGADS